jgi:antitoxin component of RelBE/YafQ-DinJ toxin-antitoxin module
MRMTQSNYALRLQKSLKLEAEQLAKEEGTTLNQLINVALAEKITAAKIARSMSPAERMRHPGNATQRKNRSR